MVKDTDMSLGVHITQGYTGGKPATDVEFLSYLQGAFRYLVNDEDVPLKDILEAALQKFHDEDFIEKVLKVADTYKLGVMSDGKGSPVNWTDDGLILMTTAGGEYRAAKECCHAILANLIGLELARRYNIHCNIMFT